MKKPLISVIVPIYKVENYLEKCIESIMAQTYDNLEIILVDDGSPDNCPKMCDDYANKDNRIKVIHKQNGGLSDARNAGIDIAKGEYLTFIDSDDYIMQDMLTVLYENMQNSNADISMCGFQFVKENASPDINFKNEVSTYENEEVFELLFNKKIPLMMTAWAKLYKAEMFITLRYPKGKIHEDEYVIHELLFNCKKLCYVDSKYYCNVERNSSITRSKYNLKRLDGIDAKKARIEFVNQNCSQYYQNVLEQYLKAIVLNYTLLKQSKLSKEKEGYLLKEFNENYKLLTRKSLILRLFKFSKLLTKVCLKLTKKI